MNTLLKWLGIAVTVLGDITGIAPALGALIGGLNGSPSATAAASNATNWLTAIAGVVANVETAFAATTSADAKTGAQKLAAVTPSVMQILSAWLASGVLGSGKVSNPKLFQAGAAQIASGMADILNSLESPAAAPSVAQLQAQQQSLAALAAKVSGQS